MKPGPITRLKRPVGDLNDFVYMSPLRGFGDAIDFDCYKYAAPTGLRTFRPDTSGLWGVLLVRISKMHI